jgi:hypothetical protein
MPLPFCTGISLTESQAAELQAVVGAHSTPQRLAFRARLILRAAEADQPSNLQVAAEFCCSRHTVALWRGRFLEQGLAGLQDAPRSGRPPVFSPLATGAGGLGRL